MLRKYFNSPIFGIATCDIELKHYVTVQLLDDIADIGHNKQQLENNAIINLQSRQLMDTNKY